MSDGNKVQHRTMIHAKCPKGNFADWDYYEVVVEPAGFLEVGYMETVLNHFRGAEGYQEELTQEIAERLGHKVTTIGRHGTTDTTVTAG